MDELFDVKSGDILFEPGRSGMNGGTFHKVLRTTATRVLVENGASYRLKDGCRVGDSGRWHSSWVRKATKADFDDAAIRTRIYEAKVLFDKVRISKDNLKNVEEFLEKLGLASAK